MTVVCPCDATSTAGRCGTTVDLAGPVYVRLGRGREPDVYDSARLPQLELGRLATLRDGGDLAIVANGITVAAALAAAERLAAETASTPRCSTRTPSARSTRDRICRLAGANRPAAGGRGAQRDRRRRLRLRRRAGRQRRRRRVGAARLGMPADEYSLIGPPTHLYRHYGWTPTASSRPRWH